ncbi:MAG: ribulose-phosphate 3-epimerase [Actinomycetota bacterium]|nr:ribulose-phosphate 3-epimerase [Actinomycetota bacterium]
MRKLGVSILNADLAHLADQVKLVEPYADLIHIDVMDAHFVPPLTIGPAVVKSLRPWTDLMLACHLMVEHPAHLYDDLADAGTEMVTFHLEAPDDPAPGIRKARDHGMRPGLALGPETPAEDVFGFLEDLDNVIVMSVHPGWGGQPFIPEVVPKIGALREEIDRRGLDVDIEMDGGIDHETGRRCLEAGATVLTAGSAIYSAPDPADAAKQLATLVKGGN